ncbi:MAG: stage II sporulation protein M [Woeseiaceae bacterium]|nr:stage II sporulation protein M [Woeseiaceae bacterium]
MKQEVFESRHRDEWYVFEQWLQSLSGSKIIDRPKTGEPFPVLYRKICHHLALARTRQYSAALQERLHNLALEGHQYLYKNRTSMFLSFARFFVRDFPAAMRRHGRYLFWSCLAFFGVGFVTAWVVQVKPEFIYMLMDPTQVARMESMYEPGNEAIGRERGSDSDIMMFGFYIYNNISIGFRTFAGGLVFGIGSLFFLVFNGLVIGGIASHLTAAGMSSTFWPFVSGHSSFELIAIVIFGAVGLAIGRQMIAPGRKTRWGAVADQARDSLPLIYGGTTMLLIAAFVEAFWSSTTWPPNSFKYIVGISLWVLHILYFTLLGRHESRKRHG